MTGPCRAIPCVFSPSLRRMRCEIMLNRLDLEGSSRIIRALSEHESPLNANTIRFFSSLVSTKGISRLTLVARSAIRPCCTSPGQALGGPTSADGCRSTWLFGRGTAFSGVPRWLRGFQSLGKPPGRSPEIRIWTWIGSLMVLTMGGLAVFRMCLKARRGNTDKQPAKIELGL